MFFCEFLRKLDEPLLKSMSLMNRIFILATIILLASCKTSTITINNTSELKEITLNEIWDGTFSPERMNALNEANK